MANNLQAQENEVFKLAQSLPRKKYQMNEIPYVTKLI